MCQQLRNNTFAFVAFHCSFDGVLFADHQRIGGIELDIVFPTAVLRQPRPLHFCDVFRSHPAQLYDINSTCPKRLISSAAATFHLINTHGILHVHSIAGKLAVSIHTIDDQIEDCPAKGPATTTTIDPNGEERLKGMITKWTR